MVYFTFFILIVNLFSNRNLVTCGPIVIAHRGASGYLPEHTLESKVMAYMMNVDFIEQDVVLTKDNVPIVLHDIYLDEVTDVADRYPEKINKTTNRFYAIEFNLDEIKTLQVTERVRNDQPVYPNRFPVKQSSFQINTLEEEIQIVKGLDKAFSSIYSLDSSGRLRANRTQPGIYVELKRSDFHKSRNRANFSEIVLSLLKKYNYTNQHDKCIIQCFEAEELIRIRRELNSSLTLVQLLSESSNDPIEHLIPSNYYDYWNSKEGLKNISTFANGIGPEKGQLITHNKRVYKASDLYVNAQEFGLFIHAYTFRIDRLPDYARSYDELLKIFIDDLKINGLFTDFPDLTLNYIRNGFALVKINYFFITITCLISIIFSN